MAFRESRRSMLGSVSRFTKKPTRPTTDSGQFGMQPSRPSVPSEPPSNAAARAACTRSAPAARRPGALPSVGPPPTGFLWMRSRMSWISRRCRSCAYVSSARSRLLTSP